MEAADNQVLSLASSQLAPITVDAWVIHYISTPEAVGTYVIDPFYSRRPYLLAWDDCDDFETLPPVVFATILITAGKAMVVGNSLTAEKTLAAELAPRW